MSLQNMRGLRIVQEDLAYSGGSVRDLTFLQTVPAASRPQIATIGFQSSIPTIMIQPLAVISSGILRMVISKSANYWMTLTGTLQSYTVVIPIAPLACVFLPTGFSGATGSMAMNSAITPVGALIATSTTWLTFDIFQEF